MKRKIISILLIITLLIIFMPKKVSARTFENSFYSYYITNKYETNYDNIDNDSSFKSYIGYDGDYLTSIIFSAYKYYELKPYTQTDVNNAVKSLKDYYAEQTDSKLTSVTGELVELNGVKGYKIRYITKYDSLEFGNIVYELRSDNYGYTISINSSKSFIDSSEANKIINSFKIKDTVLKSKNIPFTDVSEKNWYYNSVKYAYENNLIAGYNDYTFAPNDKLTRGMLVTILWRMEGSPNNDGKSKFSDVGTSAWYAKAIKWAANNGVVNGYKNGNFGPKDNITRQDLAGILRNYAIYKKKNTNKTANLTKFKDYKTISNYATTSMNWAVGTGVISGNSDGTLAPKGNATRAEAAGMIYNYCINVGR